MDNNIIEIKEYHNNGQFAYIEHWKIINDLRLGLYDYRTGLKGYEGIPVCRIGQCAKYFDNGQLAWELEYDEFGESKSKNPSYRKDGTIIII